MGFLLVFSVLAGLSFPVYSADMPVVPDPVLKMDFPDNFYPLLDLAIRDPKLNVRETGKKQLGILLNQQRLYKTWIGGKAEKKSDYRHMEYLGSLVRLSYYWRNILNSDLPEGKERKLATSMVDKYTSLIRFTAKKIFQGTRDRGIRNQVRFQVALIDYLISERRKRAVRLFSQLSRTGLSSQQKQIAQLGISLFQSKDKDPDVREKSLHSLQTLQNLLPKDISLIAHLAVSQIMASRKGPHADYAIHLKFISSLCQNLSRSQRTEIFRFSLKLWMLAEKNKPDWGTPPFRTDCYRDLSDFVALKERTGLHLWSKGDYSPARRIYMAIARGHGHPQEKILLEERAVSLFRLRYEQDGKAFPYQAYLISLTKGNEGSLFGIRLVNLHYRLIVNEIRKSREGGKTQDLSSLEKLMKNYLTSQKPDFRSHRLQVLLADLYMERNLYANAERVYGNLFQDSSGDRKRLYLVKRIAAQSRVASWSESSPWKEDLVGGQNPEAREHLLRLYYTLMQLDKSLDWSVSRHTGLLEIALSRAPKAFIIWENALRDYPKGRDAQLALGMLIARAESDGNWEKMESMVYLGLEKSVQASYQQKFINLGQKLEQALYNNALQYRKREDHQQAIKKLVVLENTYHPSPRYSEYLHMLADSYKKVKNYEKSLSTFEQILALSPEVSWYREALLEASSFYTGLADLEKSVLLYRMYLARFPEDPEITRVRMNLAEVYTGLSRYSDASEILAGVDASKLSVTEYQSLREKSFQLSEKFSSREDLLKKAADMVKDSHVPEIVRVRSYLILAENAYQNQGLEFLRETESSLRKMNEGKDFVADTLSYVSYLGVRLKSEEVMRSFKKVLTEDFSTVVSFLDSSYREISKAFRAVCQKEIVAFCVPSMQALLAFNHRILSFLEDITPSSDMGDEDRNAFMAEQQALRLVLNRDQGLLTQETRSLLAKGNTSPSATRQFLWSADKDWNFRFGQDAGTGFMQISRDFLRESEQHGRKKL